LALTALKGNGYIPSFFAYMPAFGTYKNCGNAQPLRNHGLDSKDKNDLGLELFLFHNYSVDWDLGQGG